jgi:uncharacterized membrane protein
MSDKALRAAVGALSLAGAGIAAYLTYTHYAHTAVLCTTGGCETVQTSRYAEIAGIPIALFGLGAYLVLLGTALSASEAARAVGAAVAVAGAAFSVYLIYLQLSVIDAVCQWCMASDTIMIALAVACSARVLSSRPSPSRASGA